MAEGATRNVPAFSRFLRVAACCNARVVNFTNVASDAQVPRTTVYEYVQILKDTLLVHEIPAWQRSTKRKPLATSKYYFAEEKKLKPRLAVRRSVVLQWAGAVDHAPHPSDAIRL